VNAWRGPFGVAFRQCLRTAGPPTAAAAAVAVVGHACDAPALAGDGAAAAAATPWLTLPLFVAAVGCCLVAARTWPTFARGRAGADAVRRIARGPGGGRCEVVAGAVAAQLALTLPLALALAAWLGAPADARRHVEAAGPAVPILDRPGASLRFELQPALRAQGVRLQPRASLPQGPDATTVLVTSEGAQLSDAPAAFEESQQLVRVPFPARELGVIELTKQAGHVPLLFGPGSVVAVGAAKLPRWGNAALLALYAATTSGAALLLAAGLGLAAGWSTVAATIFTAQFVQWIGGVGPIDEALQDVLRGRWLL
jgi:hypothetical protein